MHEGPQSISFRYGNMTPLQQGMIVSNEPGYYEDHSFGIRIEVCILANKFLRQFAHSLTISKLIGLILLELVQYCSV